MPGRLLICEDKPLSAYRGFAYSTFPNQHQSAQAYTWDMPFKVFLSYSTDPEENAIVWRLQTLAASHGIQMFVPQRAGARAPSARRNVPVLADEVRAAIHNSDCILAIITSRTGPAVEKELN